MVKLLKGRWILSPLPFFLSFALFISPQESHARIPIEYIDNYDGDTITFNLLELKKWDKEKKYEIFWNNISLRIAGIDTPEIKGACPQEKELAKQAKTFVRSKLEGSKKISLEEISKDKYFRILGEVYVDEVPLSQMLINHGYAIPYDGGTKVNIWCEQKKGLIKIKLSK